MTKDIATLRTDYAERGFCTTGRLLPPELVKSAIEGVDAVVAGTYDTGIPPRHRSWNPGDDPGRLVKITEPHYASQAIHDLVTYPALGMLAATVVGAAAVQAWAVDLFLKYPEGNVGGVVGWHQDASYARYWLGDVFTVWIALSTVTAEGAAVRYVPGSHMLGEVEGGDLERTDLVEGRRALDLSEGFVWREEIAELEAGAVAMHHRCTLHASGPNCSEQTRYSIAVRMRTEQCHVREVDGAAPARLAHLHDPFRAPVLYGDFSRAGS